MSGFKVIATVILATSLVSAATLPTVDLFYAIHQATINETGNYYNFSNIRYASSPTGFLRFSPPIPPTTINRTVNDGQQGRICAQAAPYWAEIASDFLGGGDAAQLETVEEELEYVESALTISSLPVPDPRTTEDCLFLDVIVPESIFNKKSSTLAPVLVWIYGGGYVNGDKTSTGNPASLIATAQENGGEGVVYVAFNYRLGLFGWLSGPTFLSEAGLPNAALYDQRLALEWVQDYIHLFGGDPSRVTVIGESAGAGSIMHQITAFGATAPAPFSQAILQSPGFPPVPGAAEQDATFKSVLTQAQSLISSDITSVSSLRKLDFATLAGLNTIVVARSSPYGTFTFGPVVDGIFVPALPGVLLLEGRFSHSLNIITAHNSNEGLEFTSPFLATEADLTANIEAVFPTANATTVSYMQNELYPPIYNGSYPYTNIFERASLITAEVSFTCNARYVDTAFNNQTWSYYFTIPPGLHGEDIKYTFFNGDESTLDDGLPVNATVAKVMQGYITNFATKNDPNGAGVPFFPRYQSNATVMVVGDEGLGSLVTDPVANGRCAWLQKALYA